MRRNASPVGEEDSTSLMAPSVIGAVMVEGRIGEDPATRELFRVVKRPTRMNIQSRTAVCVLSIVVVACGSSDPGSEPAASGGTSSAPASSDASTIAPPAQTLAERLAGRWYPVAVDGVAVDPAEGDFWSFRGTDAALGITGYDGCNAFSTAGDPDQESATIVDGRFDDLEIATEEAACDVDVEYGPFPEPGALLTISDDGTTLTMDGASGIVELSRVAPNTESEPSKTSPSSLPTETLAEQLAGRWYLVAVDGVAVDPAEGDFWSFEGTEAALRISGYDGCNSFWSIEEPGSTFASIVDGRLENVELVATERGCFGDVSGPSPQSGAELTVSDDGTTLNVEGPSASIELSRTAPATQDPGSEAPTTPGDSGSTTPGPPDETIAVAGSVDGPLMRHPDAAGVQDGMDAMVSGLLVLDDDCLYLSNGDIGERYPVLWPARTVWDSERQIVVLPTGAEVAVGESASGAGGYLSTSAVETIAGTGAAEHAARCIDNTYGEIAVVNNSATAIAPG